METYYELVKNDAEERDALFKRMDADVKLRNLEAYVMRDANKALIHGVINVTLNKPKVLATHVIAAIGNVIEQIIVETEDKKMDTDYIKDFQRLAFAAADARLQLQGRYDLNPYTDEQTCMRGGAVARCLFQLVDGKLTTDITPWDYRYTNYAIGVEGLKWASFGYKFNRKKADIESEAWAKDNKFVIITGKEAEVVDVWDTDHNEIWLAGQKVYEQEHNFKDVMGEPYVPVVIRTVSVGSMLSDAIAERNESIYFLIREAVPELNRLVSILQTLNFQSIKRAAQYASKEGTNAEPPEYEDALAPGSITSVDIGGGIVPVDLGDATRAATMALNIMNRNMDEGGLSATELGILGTPPASGIALIQAKEGKEIIYIPRLKTKAAMKQGLAQMFTNQVIQIGGSVEIGTPGHQRSFDTGKLRGQYEISYGYTVKSLSSEAGLASLSAALGNLVPDRAKRREIMQREDPDGDERWLNWEEAGRLSPLIKLRRIVNDLIELDEDEEAKLITDEAGVRLEQLLGGTVEGAKPETPQEPKQMVNLWGGGQGRQTRQPTEEQE